jgi:hypothetical protein
MFRTGLRMTAKAAVPAAALLFCGMAAGNAASLTPAMMLDRAGATVDRQIIVPVENARDNERQLRHWKSGRPGYRSYRKRGRGWRRGRRHGRHHYRRRHRDSGIGIFLNLAPRYSSRSCRYWSRRCANSWGYGNRNYYGCLRYYGC